MRGAYRGGRLGGRDWVLGGSWLLGVCCLGGCASPGPPRAPSLFLPRVVTDLSALRRGDAVELRFTVPGLSTDGQPLRAHSLMGVLCREDAEGAPCRPVDAAETARPLPVPAPGSGASPPGVWTDALPTSLRTGAPRPIAYRVELQTSAGATAGFSDPAYSAAGAAPLPVAGFRAEGTRLGVLLRWTPVPGGGQVTLERREPEGAAAVGRPGPTSSPASAGTAAGKRKTHAAEAYEKHTSAARSGKAEKGLVRLGTASGAEALAVEASGAILDNSIQPGVPYRYTAVRRERVQAGGRTLELQSTPSAERSITWQDVYPPPPPTGLTAAGYETSATDAGSAPGYAIDLVWEPVEDSQLAGYLLFRQAVGGAGKDPGVRLRLTPQPLKTPGFHDAGASQGQRYLYSVLAVGVNGQMSAADTTVIEPHVVP